MKKDIYMTKAEIPVQHGIIPAGKLVFCESSNGKTTISTLDRKFSGAVKEKAAADVLKKCKATCGNDYTLMMILDTSFHVYTAIGRDPASMYEKIITMYNYNAGEYFTIADFAWADQMLWEHIHVYRVENELIWFDDEHYALPDQELFIGDYFSLYREQSGIFGKRDWFTQGML